MRQTTLNNQLVYHDFNQMATAVGIIPKTYNVSAPLFRDCAATVTELLGEFLSTGVITFSLEREERSFAVAGGYLRNYLDKKNKLFAANLNDAESDIDVYLLGNEEIINIRSAPGVDFLSENTFSIENNTTTCRYDTLSFYFKGVKIQIIKITFILKDDGTCLIPTTLDEIIQTFDFVCCMSGFEFLLSVAHGIDKYILQLRDIVWHPDFMMTVSNKILLLNEMCTLPISLERYTKYVNIYGYSPPIEAYPKLRELLGIPHDHGKNYE